jgi:hypothetical protein
MKNYYLILVIHSQINIIVIEYNSIKIIQESAFNLAQFMKKITRKITI